MNSLSPQQLGRPFARLLALRQILYLSALLCLVLAFFMPVELAQASDEAGSSSMWIPLLNNGKSDDGGNNGGGNNGGGNPPPPPPAAEPWAFFVDSQWRTSSASTATDANGGMHMAYLYYEAVDDIENAPTYGVYLYCPGNCEEPANWNGVGLGELVNEIQVALTPNGKPRLLYRQASSQDNGFDYYYAECNQKCTEPAQWQLTGVATTRGMSIVEIHDDELPQRYFALDPQGRPRFVYSDRDSWREPDHLGTFYAYCDSDCTNAGNWFEARINKDSGNQGPYRSEKFTYPALSFSRDGRPHVVADGSTMQDEFFMFYLTCDGDCWDSGNWSSAPLFPRGSGGNVSYDVELDAQGRPRVAFYEGAQLEGKGDRLWYGWCDQACAIATNWQRYEVGLAWGAGQEPDLELDTAGKPRIVYGIYEQGALGYSWCDNACETGGAQWQHQVIETGNDLATLWPVAHPTTCDGGVWTGLTPTLALDKNGNALIGYDATYYARCYFNDVKKTWETYFNFQLVWRTARTYFLPKP